MINDESKGLDVLTSVDLLGTVFGRTFIQKFFYILGKEFQINDFAYVPHYYGPFSRELNNVISSLVQKGLLREELRGTCYVYSLTEHGKNKLKSSGTPRKGKIEEAVQKYGALKPKELIAHVYRNYPQDTISSIIRDQFT